MHRSFFLATVNTIVCVLLPVVNVRAAVHIDKPNIIYIMMDEWGYFEWSAMGHPILQTPNIDKMASEGVRFTQFLAGANVCGPTRSTLMTGQHLGHTTVRTNGGGTPQRRRHYDRYHSQGCWLRYWWIR